MKKPIREVRPRHRILTSLLYPFVKLVFKISYKLEFKKYKALKGKGPFIVLGNHTVNVDPVIMGLLFPFNLYYIATEQIFNLGFLSSLLRYIVNPIKKSKSVSDMETIRKVKRIVAQGGSIGLYPEGNTTYTGKTTNIQPATIKLIRMLKLPVIILVTEGLYLSFPRWSIYRKKGKTKSYVKRIILPDEYMKLTDESLYETIREALYINAYDDQEKDDLVYKGKKIAHGLEKLVFMDLDKNLPFVTYSEKNTLKSSVSDFSLTYQLNGKVIDNKGNVKTLIAIDEAVKASYFNYYKNLESNKLFEETGNLKQSFARHRNKLGDYEIILNKDSIVVQKKDEVTTWLFDDVKDLAIQGKYQIIVYHKDETFIIRLDKYSSPYKYLLTYQFYKYIKIGGTSINGNYRNFGI